MTDQGKRAGQSTQDMATKRYKNRVWFVLATVSVVLLILLVANNAKGRGFGGLGFLGLVILAHVIMNYGDAKTRRMMKEERRAVRGAKGEEKIGSLLEKLGEDFLIVHDIESPVLATWFIRQVFWDRTLDFRSGDRLSPTSWARFIC